MSKTSLADRLKNFQGYLKAIYHDEFTEIIHELEQKEKENEILWAALQGEQASESLRLREICEGIELFMGEDVEIDIGQTTAPSVRFYINRRLALKRQREGAEDRWFFRMGNEEMVFIAAPSFGAAVALYHVAHLKREI